jgi:O-antigen ligase
MVVKTAQILGRFFGDARLGPWLQSILVVGVGIVLSFLLISPAQSLVVSIAGVLVYLGAIVAKPLHGLLLWLIVYPFVERDINIPLGAGVPDLSPTRLCATFLLVTLLAQAAIGKRRMPGFTRTDGWAVLFVLGMAVSGFSAPNVTKAFQRIVDFFVVPLFIYFIMRNLITDRRALRHVFTALLIVATYAAAYAIYEQNTGNVLFLPSDKGLSPIQYSENIVVLQGLFGGPHIFGTLITIALPIAFYYFLEDRRKSRKALYAISLGILFAGLYFTFKRGSWVAMLGGLLIVQLFYPRFRRYFLVIAVISVAALALTWDSFTETEVYQERLNRRVDTLNGRTYRWEEAIRLWKEQPVWGYGYGQYEAVSRYYTVENMYLDILVSAGAVGFVPFIFLLVMVIKDSVLIYRRCGRDPRIFVDRTMVAIFLGSLSSYLIKIATGHAGTGATVVNAVVFMLIGAVVGSQQEFLKGPLHPEPARSSERLVTFRS